MQTACHRATRPQSALARDAASGILCALPCTQLAIMPPRLLEATIDGKLDALRKYVRDHLEELASGESSILKAVFAKRRNAEEARFYRFLHKNEARFTEAQCRHVHATLAMLAQHRESSSGAHPDARAVLEAVPVAPMPKLSGNERGELTTQEQSQSSGISQPVAALAPEPSAIGVLPASSCDDDVFGTGGDDAAFFAMIDNHIKREIAEGNPDWISVYGTEFDNAGRASTGVAKSQGATSDTSAGAAQPSAAAVAVQPTASDSIPKLVSDGHGQMGHWSEFGPTSYEAGGKFIPCPAIPAMKAAQLSDDLRSLRPRI